MALIKYNTNDYRPTSFKNFVDEFFSNDFRGGSRASFSPKVDIAETEKEFEIQLHAPGMKKEEFKIDIDRDQITIGGERKIDNKTEGKNFHSVESYFGSFNRSFHLPEMINKDKVNASYIDGILTILLPKDEEKVSRKQIEVK